MRVGLEIQGAERVAQELGKRSLHVQKYALDRGLDRAANVVLAIAKGRAPRSTAPHRTGGRLVMPGNLRKSIAKLAKYKGSLQSPVRVVGARTGRKYANDGWYAHLVEKGTVYSAAQPFMESARKQAELEVQDMLIAELKKVL